MSERTHDLKTHPEHFAQLVLGLKLQELRWNDRNYRVGDLLVLREWEPEPPRGYTGRSVTARVTHMLRGTGAPPTAPDDDVESPCTALERGWVIMSLDLFRATGITAKIGPLEHSETWPEPRVIVNENGPRE